MERKTDYVYELAQALTKLLKLMKPKHCEQQFKPSEIMTVMCILNLSSDGSAVTPSRICEELGFSKSAITAILNSLENSGMIERKVSKDDRRVIIITLTKKIDEIKSLPRNVFQAHLLNVSDNLGEEDTRKLIELLNKLIDHIQNP